MFEGNAPADMQKNAKLAELLDALSALTRAKIDVIDAQRFSSIAGARLQRAIGSATGG